LENSTNQMESEIEENSSIGWPSNSSIKYSLDEIHIKFLDREMKIKEWEDWYSVKREHVESYGGKSLLYNHYQNSVYHAVRDIYPERKWLPWRFHERSSDLWNDQKLHRQFNFEKINSSIFKGIFRLGNEFSRNEGNG
jgi:hypothetical protein